MTLFLVCFVICDFIAFGGLLFCGLVLSVAIFVLVAMGLRCLFCGLGVVIWLVCVFCCSCFFGVPICFGLLCELVCRFAFCICYYVCFGLAYVFGLFQWFCFVSLC